MPRRWRNFYNSRCNTRVEVECLPEGRPVKPAIRPLIRRIPAHPVGTRYIPRLDGALKVLFDPVRELGLNPQSAEPSLGLNVVKNGDFSDFTMDDDANTVAHWVFDDVFDIENGGVGYIGQDWKTQTATVIINDINDSNVTTSSDVTKTYVAPGIAEFEVIGTTNPFISVNGTAQPGKFHIMRCKIKAVNTEAESKTPSIGTFDTIVYGYPYQFQNSTQDWQPFEAVFYQSDSTGSQFLYALPSTIGAKVQIKDFEFIAVDGLHLVSKNFAGDLYGQLGSGSPVYEGGNVLNFDGVNDYLTIPGSKAGSLNPGTSDFTIEVWAEIPADANTNYRILAKRPNNLQGYELLLNANVVGMFYGDGTNYVQPIFAHGKSAGTYHHFAFVVDRVTNSEIRIYVDGVLLGTQDISTVTGDPSNTDDFDVGTNLNRNLFYPAKIAEIRYSNVARTEQEIKESYGLARYWTEFNSAAAGVYLNNNFSQRWKYTASTYSRLEQSLTLDTEKLYYIKYHAKDVSAGDMVVKYALNDFVAKGYGNWVSANEFVRAAFKPQTQSAYLIYQIQNALDTFFEVDEIELRPIPLNRESLRIIKDYSAGMPNLPIRDYYDSWVDNNGDGKDDNYITGDVYNDFSGVGSHSYAVQTENGEPFQRVTVTDAAARLFGKNFNVVAGEKWLIRYEYRRNQSAGNAPAFKFGGVYVNGAFSKNTNAWETHEDIVEVTDTGTTYPDWGFFSQSTGTLDIKNIFIAKVEGLEKYGVFNGDGWYLQPAHPAAFEFDGVDDYIEFPDAVTVPLQNTPFLICGWFYADDISGSPMFGSVKSSSAGDTFYYRVFDTGQIEAVFYKPGTTAYYTLAKTNSGVFQTGRWNFLAIAYTPANVYPVIFLNGNKLDTPTLRDDGNLPNLTNTYWYIGQYNGSWYFDGRVGIGVFFYDDGLELPDLELLQKQIYERTKHYYEVE